MANRAELAGRFFKAATPTAIGLAVAEGRLTVDDRLVDHFPDLVPADAGDLLKAIRIRHLLTMSSGHEQARFLPLYRPSPNRAAILADVPAVEPGSRFDYSNSCSYMLAALVERVTGETLADYLGPRIFAPLGIERRHWLRTEEGVTNGGWGLHLTTRELARFGQLYLDRGRHHGRQLIPEAWIDEATSKQIDSWNQAALHDWRLGYGYQFWRGSHGSYRMDGLMGQFCVVLPALDAFVVTTAGTLRTQRLLELIWEVVVPTLGGSAPPPPPDTPLRPLSPTSPRFGELAGRVFRIGERIVLPTRLYDGQSPLATFAITAGNDGLELIAADETARYRLRVGTEDWVGGTTPFGTGYPEPYRARGGWETASRFVVDLVFTEAGYRLSLAFDLDTAQVGLTLPLNPGLEGRLVIGRPFP